MTGSLIAPVAGFAPHRPWTTLASHRRWLDEQASALTRFASASIRPEGGFWWLDAAGRPDPAVPLETWIACRMTYVFTLAGMLGEPGAGPIADHGIAALSGPLRDARDGGWFASVGTGAGGAGFGAVVGDRSGVPVDDRKAAYPHAFVVLAASAATIAGRPGAADLLDEALGVVARRFWDDDAGRTRESFTRDWSVEEPYRGANSSMHMVEAFLAAGSATGDRRWYERALRICAHLVHDVAARHDWRLPEHFTPAWQPDLDYHADRPADPFRPYGSTIGHWFEWSRLLLCVEAALDDPPRWLAADARSLFEAAVARGWAADGADGLVYTIAWDDTPVVRSRMHWVAAEAIAAAAALSTRTGEPVFESWYRTFWDYAQRYVIDTDRGSWHHELDPDNRPATTVWRGKPDVYHAYQAVLLPQYPLAPTLAAALADAITPAGATT